MIDADATCTRAVALAVDNVQLYVDLRRQLAESESLQRITTALLRKLSLADVAEAHEMFARWHISIFASTGARPCCQVIATLTSIRPGLRS